MREHGAALSANDRRVLTATARAQAEWDGLAPHGAADWTAIRRLQTAGLVQCEGVGECADCCELAGDCPHEVTIYALTDAGRLAVDGGWLVCPDCRDDGVVEVGVSGGDPAAPIEAPCERCATDERRAWELAQEVDDG